MTRKHWFHLALVGAVALGGIFASSHAEADDPQDDEVPAAVAALCKEALGHVRKGDFEGARTLYLKAFDASPNAGILFNLALTELNSNHPLDALRHFREYPHARRAEKASIARVQAELLPKAFAATGHITMENAPDPAIFYIDGNRVTEFSGNTIDVVPGHHFVGARTPGMGWVAEVDVRAGESATARLHVSWVYGGDTGSVTASDAGAPITAPADGGARR